MLGRCFSFRTSSLSSCYILLFYFPPLCMFLLVIFNFCFLYSSLEIVYSCFSSFGSLEFQFLVGTSYFGNFLYLGIHYSFHLYIFGFPNMFGLNQSPKFQLLIFFPENDCWSRWYTSLHISKHSSVSSSYLLHSFISHITLLLKVSYFFLCGSNLFECDYTSVYFSIFIHPFYYIFWRIFILHSVQIHKGIVSSYVPASVLSFLKYSSIISCFHFIYVFSFLL